MDWVEVIFVFKMCEAKVERREAVWFQKNASQFP